MDALNKLLEAVSIKGRPDENLDQYYNLILASKEMSIAEFLPFLQTLAAQVESSKTLEVLRKWLNRGFCAFFTGMNLKEFSNLYPFEPGFLLKVLRVITSSKQVYSILDLTFRTTEENECTSLLKMEQTILTEFTKMKNLNKIVIDSQYYFTLDELVEMANKLPALRTLKVVIDSESQFPIENPYLIKKDTFQHLEEFVYSTTKIDVGKRSPAFASFERFTNFCILHLPNLREVRCLNMIFDTSFACGWLQRTSLLEHLQLNPNFLNMVAANAEKFPHVTSLSLNWGTVGKQFDSWNWESLEKFPKLNHVKNYDLNSHHFATFIIKFGANLKSLYFGYTTEYIFNINLKQIKEHCPKLAKLEIVGTDVDDRYSLESFTSLLDLQITFKTNVRKEVKLFKLLAAPNLKIVKLSGFRVNKDEFRITQYLIKTKKILTKVETLSLMLDARMIQENRKKAVVIEKRFEKFIEEVRNVRQGVHVGQYSLFMPASAFQKKSRETCVKNSKDLEQTNSKISECENIWNNEQHQGSAVHSDPSSDEKLLLMASSGESSSVDTSEAFKKPFGDFMQLIRSKVAPMGSSKTLKLLSGLLDRKYIGFFPGMNFEEFSNLFPSEPDFLLKVLRLYTSPNHAESILDLNIFAIEKNECSSPPKMEREMWNLMEMSRNLPALKKLKVMIDSDSRPQIEDPDFAQIFKNRFSNLEEFIYSTRDSASVDYKCKLVFFGKFTNFCIKHLPKAREVRCEEIIFDMTKACEEMEHTSLMEHLEFLPNNLDLVASYAEKFPHVSALTLDWNKFKFTDIRNKEKWDSLKKFKKLAHLKNSRLDSPECLQHVLSILGANLRILSFCFAYVNTMDIDFELIQENCPKLEKLDSIETFVDDRYSLGTFHSLLDLQITFKYFYTKEVKISNLLAAPNLKIAKLRGFRVSKDELKRTILLIKTKAILTKVEILSLTMDGSIDADLKIWMGNGFGFLVNALRNVRQGEVSVSFDFDC
ncbi:Hypothetical predicted protein [Cloeon dipterum]|uniref:Uncharacterized protein n=1 Tax=Cloeon dipterum TaxID=197152 RepID=A0A8S1CW59_9INSE|nr:Hypothetical predicted protein [Cloeon dipterum]